MIEVFVENPDKMDDYLPAIREAVGQPHGLTDWRFRNRTFFGALEVERNVMFLILTMIVLVAALNIVSGLTMLVKDKARGIAILRTMGATRGSILSIFVITGAAIGVGGHLVRLVARAVDCRRMSRSLRQLVSWLSGAHDFPARAVFPLQAACRCAANEVITIVLMALVLSLARHALSGLAGGQARPCRSVAGGVKT